MLWLTTLVVVLAGFSAFAWAISWAEPPSDVEPLIAGGTGV